MPLFNGTYVQNFDAKGRVSIPASFRAALRAGAVSVSTADDGPISIPLVLRPSDRQSTLMPSSRLRLMRNWWHLRSSCGSWVSTNHTWSARRFAGGFKAI